MEPGQVATGRVCVGAVRGSFGVRGEVRLASFTAEPGAIGGYGELEAEDGSRLFSIESLRPIKGGFAARMAGVACREEAAALRGTKLFVARDRLPEPGNDEYYWTDLAGSEAFDRDGTRIGRVAGVHNFGAGDLLEIALDDGGANEYVPFTHQDVPEVHKERVVLACWPRPEGDMVVAGPASDGPAGG
jgi:16S rRNA processing protein RimM